MKRIEKLKEKPRNHSFREMMEGGKKEKEAFEELFECMQQMVGLKEILQKHKITAAELFDISSRLSCVCDYHKGHYLPVALVAFGKPHDYILNNKDNELNYGYEEVCRVVEKVIPLI